jgi:bacillithiol biosynthesis cysteine-adding enzyme BshC
MADAFEATIADLFAAFDIVVVSSAHAAVRGAAAPVLLHELANQAGHAALLARTTAALEAAGYDAQVAIAPAVSNVFHHADGRDRLVRENDTWHHRRSRTRISDARVRELLAAEPDAFSPNVLLRPVVESALFPTLAYVAGPGELAYFAQIGCLFRAHGIEPPVVFPRHAVTLVHEKVRRVLDRHALHVTSFQRPTHVLVNDAVRGALPADVAAALGALRAAVDDGFGELATAALPIDPTLAGPLDGARRHARERLADVERRIVARLRERDGITRRQIERAAVWIHPDHAAQERRLNIFGWLGRYGPELLPALAAAFPVALDTAAPEWRALQCD